MGLQTHSVQDLLCTTLAVAAVGVMDQALIRTTELAEMAAVAMAHYRDEPPKMDQQTLAVAVVAVVNTMKTALMAALAS